MGNNPLNSEEPFVTIEDLAAHLAISVPTVRMWIRQGKITSGSFLKLGNTYRFKQSEVVADLTRYADNLADMAFEVGNKTPETVDRINIDLNSTNEEA